MKKTDVLNAGNYWIWVSIWKFIYYFVNFFCICYKSVFEPIALNSPLPQHCFNSPSNYSSFSGHCHVHSAPVLAVAPSWTYSFPSFTPIYSPGTSPLFLKHTNLIFGFCCFPCLEGYYSKISAWLLHLIQVSTQALYPQKVIFDQPL